MKSSVIVISHEREQLLRRALNSLNSQELLPDEVILVDDNSVSFDVNIFRNIYYKFNLKIFKNSKKKGANFSRNLGIKKSAHEILFFLDDDDEFRSDKLKILMREFGNDGKIALVTSGFYKYYEDYDYSKTKYKKGYRGKISQIQTLKRNIIGGTSMVGVKREVVLECGGFDEALPALQDKELWLRIAKGNFHVLVVPEPLVKYRIASSVTRISNNVNKFWAATNYIENKHIDVKQNMSLSDLIEYDVRNLQLVGLKCLLNHQRRAALIHFMAALKRNLTAKNLAILVLLLLPIKLIIRLL